MKQRINAVDTSRASSGSSSQQVVCITIFKQLYKAVITAHPQLYFGIDDVSMAVAMKPSGDKKALCLTLKLCHAQVR